MWELLSSGRRKASRTPRGASLGEVPRKQGVCSEVCLFKFSALAAELIHSRVKNFLLSSSGTLESQKETHCAGHQRRRSRAGFLSLCAVRAKWLLCGAAVPYTVGCLALFLASTR